MANGHGDLALALAGHKVCRVCGEDKPLVDFKNRKGSPDGKRNDCRKCSGRRELERRERPEVMAGVLAAQRVRRRRNYSPVTGRAQNIAFRFGLTLDQYDAMLAAQGGTCAICESDNDGKSFDIDHDHSCCPGIKTCGNCVRGLLCGKCNKGLGHFGDSLERMKNAITYLEGQRG